MENCEKVGFLFEREILDIIECSHCDLFEDRRIKDVTINSIFPWYHKGFYVVVGLFNKRSQMTSKCGKNISDTLSCVCVPLFLFLPHFDVICDLFLNTRPRSTESVC